jgi:arylsulfatase A-like enzyme
LRLVTVLRRFTLLLTGLAVVGAGLLAPAASRSTRARAGGIPRPNVLIIVTDDQRSGETMDVMPSTRHWLQDLGTTYPNTYVSVPLCCPSRASIMTGRYAHNHGVVDNTSHNNLDQRTTLQYLLQRSGYRTSIVGKYFNGWPQGVDPPFFDRWAIFRSGYYETKFNVDGKRETIHRYATDYISKQSVKVLKSFEKKDAKPWLMYVTTSAPHEPFTPAPRYANAPVPPWDPAPSVGEKDKSDKPPAIRGATGDEAGGAVIRDSQLRSLLAVDEMVGKLMQTLGELRERERTLVLFLSDNGYFWAEHGLSDKRLPYTEAISVPLLARWPGRIAPGATDQRLVSLVDIAPTVLQAAGVAPDPFSPQDGRSLLDTWQRDRIFVEYFPDSGAGGIGPWASLRTRDVQYVEYYGADRVTVDFREYYDLQKDPYQLQNLLGDGSPSGDPSPMELQALAVQLARDRSCSGTSGATACP